MSNPLCRTVLNHKSRSKVVIVYDSSVFCHGTNNLWTLLVIIQANFSHVPFLLRHSLPCPYHVESWLVRKLIQKRLYISIQHSKRGPFCGQLLHTYSPKWSVWHVTFRGGPICCPPSLLEGSNAVFLLSLFFFFSISIYSYSFVVLNAHTTCSRN